MAALPTISCHERFWNAEVARRRPDLVAEEAGSLERMTARYLELVGSPFGSVGTVLTDRARVLRHLIDRAADGTAAEDDPASAALRQLAEQVGGRGVLTERQVECLAALLRSHPGARAEMMATGDGTIVVNFGPRRGNGAYVVDPQGRSRWVTPASYAA